MINLQYCYFTTLRWLEEPIEESQHSRRRFGYCQLCRNLHGINIDDVYSSRFNESELERPLLSTGVSHRTIPPIKQLVDSIEPKECFSTKEDLQTVLETLPTRAFREQ